MKEIEIRERIDEVRNGRRRGVKTRENTWMKERIIDDCRNRDEMREMERKVDRKRKKRMTDRKSEGKKERT